MAARCEQWHGRAQAQEDEDYDETAEEEEDEQVEKRPHLTPSEEAERKTRRRARVLGF